MGDPISRAVRRGIKHHSRASLQQQDCTSTQLYQNPILGSTFDASSGPIEFTWNTTCLDASKVTLTLRAPSSSNPVIKIWSPVTYADGSYSVTLAPKWWNSSTVIDLQMTMSLSDSSLSFVSSIPVGPIFHVTYPADLLVTTIAGGSTTAAAAANTATPDPVVVNLTTKHSLSVGKIFAATFFPVLALLALIGVYLVYARRRQAEKRKRWSSAVDKRMSVLSEGWQSEVGSSPSRTIGGDRRTIHSVASNNFAGFGTWRGQDEGTEPQMQEISRFSIDSPEARPRASFVGEARPRVSFAEARKDEFAANRASTHSFPVNHGRVRGMKTSKSMPHGTLSKLATNSPPRSSLSRQEQQQQQQKTHERQHSRQSSGLIDKFKKGVSSHKKAPWSVSGIEASAMTNDGKGRDLILLSPEQKQGPWSNADVEELLSNDVQQRPKKETVGRLRESFRYPVGDARRSVASALAEHYDLDLEDEPAHILAYAADAAEYEQEHGYEAEKTDEKPSA
ncbi:Protein of unknown function DUF4448 [Phaffia rhodozyma]|uniref:Uncharacterized protein n=1 Tax=Phaffia rhodozyma TaxID=264483 RepID=A0A0F7SPC3_PHARH|nr:Protein of unknown function DUF4448 [Phaffia rhodozyma]